MFVDDLRQDLRYTARSLRRDAGFTTFAILIAGLGIGASAICPQVPDDQRRRCPEMPLQGRQIPGRNRLVGCAVPPPRRIPDDIPRWCCDLRGPSNPTSRSRFRYPPTLSSSQIGITEKSRVFGAGMGLALPAGTIRSFTKVHANAHPSKSRRHTLIACPSGTRPYVARSGAGRGLQEHRGGGSAHGDRHRHQGKVLE